MVAGRRERREKEIILKNWQEIVSLLLHYEIVDNAIILHLEDGVLKIPNTTQISEEMLGRRVAILKTDNDYLIREIRADPGLEFGNFIGFRALSMFHDLGTLGHASKLGLKFEF